MVFEELLLVPLYVKPNTCAPAFQCVRRSSCTRHAPMKVLIMSDCTHEHVGTSNYGHMPRMLRPL